MSKERKDALYMKNAAGLYVLAEPVDAEDMSAATTGDVLTVKSDDTVHPRTIVAGTDITVTVNADDITIASTASGGSGAAILYDSTLASPATNIDTGAAGIAGGYDLLEVWMMLRTSEAVAVSGVAITVNADTGNNYDWQFIRGVNTTASANVGAAQAGWLLACPGNSATANVFGIIRITIPGYTQTVAQKVGELTAGNADVTAANRRAETQIVQWRNTAAITRMKVLANSASNLATGSRMLIFGR